MRSLAIIMTVFLAFAWPTLLAIVEAHSILQYVRQLLCDLHRFTIAGVAFAHNTIESQSH